MNELSPITINADPQPGTALATIRSALPTILAADTNDILGKLAEEIAAFEPDVSTEKGRRKIASLAAKVASSKMDLIRLGKGLTEDSRKQIAAVNAECRVIEDRMDALKRRVRQPLDELEAAEAARIKANEDAIATLEALTDGLATLTSEQITERFNQAGVVAEFNWSPEFITRAERVQNGAIAQIEVAFRAAKQREADAAAEVVRAAQEAETNRRAAIQAQQERDAQIAAEATRVAEAEAARKAEIAAAAAQAAIDAAAAREAHAKELAARLAAQAETKRIDTHKAALAVMQKLAVPLTPPDPLPVIDAKLDRLADVSSTEWEEFADEAAEIYAASHAALTTQRGAAIQAETLAAAERAKVIADRAEITRKAEAAHAERNAAAAVEAERKRVADEEATALAAAEKRSADKKHQAKINGEVLADLQAATASLVPLSEANARLIVIALAKGEIRHCRIGY